MTDSEKAALCARIDELCAENEKLRGQGARLFDKTLELGTENSELRELVVTLMACVSVDDCDKCPINGAEFKASEVRCCREAKQRMQELGIEVYG